MFKLDEQKRPKILLSNTAHLPETLPYWLTFKGGELFVDLIQLVWVIVESFMASFTRSDAVSIIFDFISE